MAGKIIGSNIVDGYAVGDYYSRKVGDVNIDGAN